MPPKKLTPAEQAFLDKWTTKMCFFLKMLRRADMYIATIPRETYYAAYDEINTAGAVAGQDNPDPSKRTSAIEREEREAYIQYMENVIEQHPIDSPKNAVMTLLASNSGMMCINRDIIIEQPPRVRDQFHIIVTKFGRDDFKKARGPQNASNAATSKSIEKDPDEDDSNTPFVRARQQPQRSTRLTKEEWKDVKRVGETYFVEDQDDETEWAAFELTSILTLKTGTFYNICWEHDVDSVRVTEEELSGMIDAGVWT